MGAWERNLAKVGVASSSLVFRSETQRTIERLSSAFFSVLRSGWMILYLVFRGAGVSIKVCEITCRSAGSNSVSFFMKRWFIIREKSWCSCVIPNILSDGIRISSENFWGNGESVVPVWQGNGKIFGNKRKTPACHRQAGYNWIRGNILRDRSQKPFIFRQITASVSLSFGNYRSKTDCWLWPTSFPFRYSVGEIPTYCLKYLPKKDWVEKFSSEAISLILKSEERSICLASAMTMRMIHCRAEMPDFSLMIAEK